MLRLRATPAAVSEIRSDAGVHRIAGRLTAVLPRPGGVLELACTGGGGRRLLRARAGRRTTTVELLAGAGSVRQVRGPRVTLRLSPSATPAGDCGALSVRGSRGSDLRVRLDGLRLH